MTPGRMCSPRQSTSRAAEARDRSPRAAIRPARTPWFTTTPPLRIRSKVWGMAISSLEAAAERAYVTLLAHRAEKWIRFFGPHDAQGLDRASDGSQKCLPLLGP